MTLFKLSLRNARRQARDYLVYFVSVVMAAALLYAFNGLVFSQEILNLSRRMAQMPSIIVLASIVVVCVFGWLVSYTTNFMLSRRSRELGTYILIGLENRQVARLFFLENLAAGGCALLSGLLVGNLLFQALRAIVLSLFGMPYGFSFTFSLPTVGLTAVYFVLIYLYALRRSRKRIKKMKIYDLIYFDRLNEGVVIQTGQKRRRLFTVSIVLGVAGTFLIMAGNFLLGILGAGSLIVCLYGFFPSFASSVPAFFDRHPARKYKGQNLLVFRTLAAKLATMGVLMATISMIFTATLISEGTGMVFHGTFAGRAAENACFDLYIGMEDTDRLRTEYADYIEKNIPVEKSLQYKVYCGENTQVMDYLNKNTSYYSYGYERDSVMRYSDYAALREIAGYPAVHLQPGQYLIHCMDYLEGVLKSYQQPLALGDDVLDWGGVYTEHMIQDDGLGNGVGFVLVVPDESAKDLPFHHLGYAAKTVHPVVEEQFYDLYDIHYEIHYKMDMQSDTYDTIYTKASEEADMAVMTAAIVFPLYFLALALTITAATILTVQQLSESERYKRQFEMLHKLGMDWREMAKALRWQFAIYYIMPAVPPVLIGLPFILNLAKMPEPGVMVGLNSPAAITGIAFGLFVLLYALYILLAYTNLKRNVLPERGY